MSPSLKKLIKEISFTHNIPIKVVEKVVEAQFLFVKETMANGIKNVPESFKSINLTHLGKFSTRDYVLKQFKKNYDNRTKDSN